MTVLPADLVEVESFNQSAAKVFSRLNREDEDSFEEFCEDIKAPTLGDESGVLISVSVYSSNFRTPPASAPLSAYPHIKIGDFQFSGNDTLVELLNKLSCLTNRVARALKLGQDLEEECFCLIEGVFYDDLTSNGSRPSDPFIQAIKNTSRSLASLGISDPKSVQQQSLSQTKWSQVPIRLDHPYLLVHQGGCEHHFVITQIRHTQNINNSKLNNPVLVKPRRRACRICETYNASRLLINDKLMPENPTAICDACFEGFHPQNGREDYTDYEVLPYFHDL